MACDLVTGAFGFTGSRIAARLLARGRTVRTLTRRDAARHLLAERVAAERPAYDAPARLRRQLEGVERLFVTYWMRFPRGSASWPRIVDDVGRLVACARAAGVGRIVYVSVSNAAPDAPTAYFRAKAAAEEEVRRGGVSHAIVRPTLLYGEGDILINNMAWTLRRVPLFGVPGDGRYLVQPVHVDDVAALCVALGDGADTVETDAAGAEVFAFDELVRTVGSVVGSRARLIHLPPLAVLAATRLIGIAVRDVVLTRDEIRELMAGLLAVPAGRPHATGPTRFSEWLARHGREIGRRYSSELARNFRFKPR